jgi:hypothetical protein
VLRLPHRRLARRRRPRDQAAGVAVLHLQRAGPVRGLGGDVFFGCARGGGQRVRARALLPSTPAPPIKSSKSPKHNPKLPQKISKVQGRAARRHFPVVPPLMGDRRRLPPRHRGALGGAALERGGGRRRRCSWRQRHTGRCVVYGRDCAGARFEVGGLFACAVLTL